MTHKDAFTWFNINGESVHDGAIMVYLFVVECNPETKVGMWVLRKSISSTKSLLHENNISEILENIASTITRIRDLGETHDNLIKDTFEALLTEPNT